MCLAIVVAHSNRAATACPLRRESMSRVSERFPGNRLLTRAAPKERRISGTMHYAKTRSFAALLRAERSLSNGRHLQYDIMPRELDLIARRAAESLGERIRRRRRELGLTQATLAKNAGVNQGFLSEIERGKSSPSPRTVDALAIALDVPQTVLIGGSADHDNPQPLEARELPLFGSIPAGPPSETQEQLDMFPVLRHQWSPDYYCLRLTFDSMEPTLKPGDIVLVHFRPSVEPEHVQGKICACLLGGQPTLKRVSVEWRDGQRIIILRGDNPRVQPTLIEPGEDFAIQGIVVRLVCREL